MPAHLPALVPVRVSYLYSVTTKRFCIVCKPNPSWGVSGLWDALLLLLLLLSGNSIGKMTSIK